MMFATLDDLEGQVELLIFGRTLAASEEAFEMDAVITLRGRVDHKDASKTTVVVQEAELFAPSEEEVAAAEEEGGQAARRPAGLPPAARRDRACARTMIDDLKSVIENSPGDSPVLLEIHHLHRPARAAPRPDLQSRPAHGAQSCEDLGPRGTPRLDHLFGATPGAGSAPHRRRVSEPLRGAGRYRSRMRPRLITRSESRRSRTIRPRLRAGGRRWLSARPV